MQRHQIQRALHAERGDAGVVVPGSGAADRSDVQQCCPECGGQLTSQLDASILVRICWACQGTGVLNDHQLSVYLGQLNDRAANNHGH